MAAHGIGLCARWRLVAQKYQTVIKIDRSTTLEYSTEPPLAQNPCYLLLHRIISPRSDKAVVNFFCVG
jgi:hypothetical protein